PLFVAQNLCKFPVAVCKQGAICQQLIAFRPIDTAKRQQIILREMKIEDRTLALDGGPEVKDSGGMGLVWSLVVRETRVAIDAVYGLFRQRNVIGCKALELCIQGVDQLQHGQLDQGLVLFLAGLEPIAAIVALERTQKGESVRREAGEARFRLCHI